MQSTVELWSLDLEPKCLISILKPLLMLALLTRLNACITKSNLNYSAVCLKSALSDRNLVTFLLFGFHKMNQLRIFLPRLLWRCGSGLPDPIWSGTPLCGTLRWVLGTPLSSIWRPCKDSNRIGQLWHDTGCRGQPSSPSPWAGAGVSDLEPSLSLFNQKLSWSKYSV